MKKIELKYRKLLRAVFGCISFTAVAFVFQACYGVREDYDVRLTGTVRSKTTNLPIKGIKVVVDVYGYDCGFTNEEGKFDFNASVPRWDYYYNDSVRYPSDSIKVQFLDIDSLENDYFEDKTIFIDPARKKEVKIHVELEEKQ